MRHAKPRVKGDYLAALKSLRDDDGRGNLVVSCVTPNVPIVSRIHRDRFIPDLRAEVAKVLREARGNGHRIVVNRAGRSWTILIGTSHVVVEIHS